MSTEPIDGSLGRAPLLGSREYRKTARVFAVQMEEPFAVDTEEGLMRGQAGDYLCQGPAGECWPIKRQIFESTYVEV